MKRSARRFGMTILVALVILYMIGGVGGLRRARARVRAWMQPPTQAEMQAASTAVPDTLPSLPRAPTRTRRGEHIAMSEPPSTAAITGVIGGVLMVAILLMLATGRDGRTE